MTQLERNDLFERDEFVERLRYRATIWRYLGAVISGWWADRQAYAMRRRAMVRLSEMEDWQLRDIGIERSEVEKMLHRYGVARPQGQAAQSIKVGHTQ
ncbi:DUF1127 domain-containing protein [Pelagibacterium flavum]|uniref:DUF1127 domain-containing protein n=1 Tax=Pelagibacterium flavum TaxID=2984530 RepID=A0ABY6IKD6_9HYPH|nr:DUF1127 domain-containing protein [Pelagibacterium sp. YIM 151497]UYQ71033.1 DUF1127 domain-containing protein [Pelagibacterium sp. YIM 151497]